MPITRAPLGEVSNLLSPTGCEMVSTVDKPRFFAPSATPASKPGQRFVESGGPDEKVYVW